MASLNKIQIIGNIGRNAEVKDVNGHKLITFSVAVTQKYNDKEHTDWFDCNYFCKGENLVNYLKKGTIVFVEGQMCCRQYDKEGQKRIAWSVRVSNVQLLSSSKKNNEMPPEVKGLADKFGAIEDRPPF